jgi:hypothetical protein
MYIEFYWYNWKIRDCGRPWSRWQNNTEMYLKEIACKDVDGIQTDSG